MTLSISGSTILFCVVKVVNIARAESRGGQGVGRPPPLPPSLVSGPLFVPDNLTFCISLTVDD